MWKSLGNITAAAVVAGVAGALALAPVAGISGVGVARTNETMQSNLADLTDGTTPGVTTITDVTGQPIAWLYDQRRYPVAGDQISQHMKDAIVAIEDHRFYEHDGVDIQGTVRAMATNVLAGGYEGDVYLVNPKADTIAGRKVFKTVGDIPGSVDLAVVTVPAVQSLKLIPELKAKGIRYMLLISSGFGEVGPEGRELEKKLIRTAAEAGVSVLGPNTMGTAVSTPSFPTTKTILFI